MSLGFTLNFTKVPAIPCISAQTRRMLTPSHAKVLSLEDKGAQSFKMAWEQPESPGFRGGSGHSQEGLSLGSPPRCSEYHLVTEMWSQLSTGWDAGGRAQELLLCQNHDLCACTQSRGSLPRGDGLPGMHREHFPFLTSSSLQQHHVCQLTAVVAQSCPAHEAP